MGDTSGGSLGTGDTSGHASHDGDSEIVQNIAQCETNRLIAISCAIVMFSYFLGLFQITSTIPIMFCVYIFWLTKEKVSSIYSSLNDEHQRREHTRRALENAETVEWFNTLLNRWWCFSAGTIESLIKNTLDPLFESCKPKAIESIEMTKFSLGTRTPYLKYIKVFEMTDDMRKKMATDVTCRNPPSDITTRQKYQIAIDADMGLEAPQSQLVIAFKILGKLGRSEVIVEQFKLKGRMQLILYFNQNIAFPHLAAVSFSFLSQPKVSFGIKLLKAIKLMEFPMIRSWIEELVHDSLKISLVDPGHVTIPLCDDPEIIGRQVGYASGVLTLAIRGGAHGRATSDEQWCSITLDKQKIRTKEITSDNIQWKEEVSLLVRSLQFDKLKVKIKGKRRFGPNYTVVEYVLPLVRLNLEQECDQEMTLQEDNIEGSDLNVSINYFSLPVLDLSNDSDEQYFTANYIEKNGESEPGEVAGVLFVRVHKGISLIPMDSSGTSDPYVMIFANSEFVHLGHIIEENLNPEWDTMVEFFTLDYTQTTLSFVVHDRDTSTIPNMLTLIDDNDDFMGSCNMPLTKEDWCVFKRSLDLHYKIKGDQKRGVSQTMRKVGKLIVSVIFRPVSSIKSSVRGSKNCSLPEGEPLHEKKTKIDAVTLEAMLCSERGSLTICILRARNLVALDINGRSDPFVSIRVGNSKQEKYKTKVVYRTLNPVWNEQVTLAMPQKHEKISIEVFDKDAFTQERIGTLLFDYKQLIELGGGDEEEKRWFDLQDAKCGEIQLAFKAVPPDSIPRKEQDDRLVDSIQTYSFGNDSEVSDTEEFLVLEDGKNDGIQLNRSDENGDTILKQMSIPVKMPNGGKNTLLKLPEFDEGLIHGKDDDIVDFSGEPQKYFGIHGKIIDLTGLTLSDIDEIYVKVKLDRQAMFSQNKRTSMLLPRTNERLLCKTDHLSVSPKININKEFEIKSDVGVSPSIYLIIEVKSDKKGKDVVDSKSILMGSIFKGETNVVRIIELDNGGKIKIQVGHTTDESGISHRRNIIKHSKVRSSVS